MIRRSGAAALILAGLIGWWNGARAEQQFKFEVASVKANRSANARTVHPDVLPGGRFIAVNVPLYVLIANAYGVPFDFFGTPRFSGPGWLRSERFDVDAIPDQTALRIEGISAAQKIRLMLQALLRERFKLRVRTREREMRVYAIVAARTGPKLRKSSMGEKDCVDPVAELLKGHSPTGQKETACHQISGAPDSGMQGSAVDLNDVARFVEHWTDRPVVDRSGFKTLFQIDTSGWIPMRSAPVPPVAEGTADTTADSSRPTLFMIFERLGLKLQSQKAPIEIYTIEHVERPTEN